MFFNENRQISEENITNVTRTAWYIVLSLNTFVSMTVSLTILLLMLLNIIYALYMKKFSYTTFIYIVVIIFNYITYIHFYIKMKYNIHGVLMIILKNKNVIISLW